MPTHEKTPEKPKAAARTAPKPAKPAAKKTAASTNGKVEAQVESKIESKAKVGSKSKSRSKTKAEPKVVETPLSEQKAQVLKSEVVWDGKLFRVLRDTIIEPSGHQGERDIVRHNGSVVILAVDTARSKKNPWIVMERQYRHAAGQFLWEIPAGKLETGEDPVEGAKRELSEETGYLAKKWKPLVEYFASPGFLAESMKVYLAEGLVAGDAHPEEDEKIELRLIRLSDLLKMIDKGMIQDGKTLTSVLLYARQLEQKRKK